MFHLFKQFSGRRQRVDDGKCLWWSRCSGRCGHGRWVRRLEGECITEMRFQKRTNETAENLHAVSCLKKTKLPAFVDLVLQFSRGGWPCSGMQKMAAGQSFCWTRHSFSLSCRSTCLQAQALLSNMWG